MDNITIIHKIIHENKRKQDILNEIKNNNKIINNREDQIINKLVLCNNEIQTLNKEYTNIIEMYKNIIKKT